MTERRVKARKDDLPGPWETRPISRERWLRHRETLMKWENAGSRPPEWWLYERNLQPPDEREAELLMAMGELSATELGELVPDWRVEYEKTLRPNFAYCIGHAKVGDTYASWLEGEEARQAHLEWAGIPKLLLKQWEKERRAKKGGTR